MMRKRKKGQVVLLEGLHPWSHELRVAEVLARDGHAVEFLPTAGVKTADILLDGVEFEIKSPKSVNANSLEHLLKKALKQSPNIIIDISRTKGSRNNICNFLLAQMRSRKGLKN